MSLLDERYDPKSAISRRRREEQQKETDANSIGRQPVTWDNLLQTREELAEVKRWQDTATGKNGITITGNVFTGPAIPILPEQSFNTEVLVIAPTDAISSIPTEISTAVPWPDGTACTVDMGDQDPSIIFGGYWVEGGNLYLRWVCFGSGTPLSGQDITITAFLPN